MSQVVIQHHSRIGDTFLGSNEQERHFFLKNKNNKKKKHGFLVRWGYNVGSRYFYSKILKHATPETGKMSEQALWNVGGARGSLERSLSARASSPTPHALSPRSNAKTYVTSGCHCLEKSVSVQIVHGAKFVRKLCWKYSDKTKYEAIKSEVNKQELFYRYSTFKASLSRNCFIFWRFEKVFWISR